MLIVLNYDYLIAYLMAEGQCQADTFFYIYMACKPRFILTQLLIFYSMYGRE